MGIITKMRKQKAVLWVLTPYTTSSGDPIWVAPQEILVRFELQIDIQGLGEVLRHKGTAYVGQDLKTGDYLMIAPLTSGVSSDPRNEESWLVQQFDKIPNLKATEWLRTVQMVPSHKTLLALKGRGTGPITYMNVTGASRSSAGVLTLTTSTIPIAVAIQYRMNYDEIENSRGRFRAGDIVWEVPKFLLSITPGMEDWIIAADGSRWDVISFEENRLLSGTWWRIFTRRGAV